MAGRQSGRLLRLAPRSAGLSPARGLSGPAGPSLGRPGLQGTPGHQLCLQEISSGPGCLTASKYIAQSSPLITIPSTTSTNTTKQTGKTRLEAGTDSISEEVRVPSQFIGWWFGWDNQSKRLGIYLILLEKCPQLFPNNSLVCHWSCFPIINL